MDYISLSQLASTIKLSVNRGFPSGVWIKGEISQMSINQSSGHCYMTLIEKDPRGNSPIAKINANIWRNNYERISHEFEHTAGVAMRAGMEIIALAMVDYSPIYGLSVNVMRIDATYNLGLIAKQRLENIALLKSEGVFDMNRTLSFPSLPFRVAVISSATAAGYEDFIDQLENSSKCYPFRTSLFHCLMQGDRSAEGMLNALDDIIDQMENFDCVVIIRGGGASSDLLAFDDIDVSRVCAQFPLPILTGIGHTRDESIVDMVSHLSLKTPTAVASYLIERIEYASEMVEDESSRLNNAVHTMLERASNTVLQCSKRLPQLCQMRLSVADNHINMLTRDIKGLADRKIIVAENNISTISNVLQGLSSQNLRTERTNINDIENRLKSNVYYLLKEHSVQIELTEHKVRAADPISILQKGFTYTEQGGQTISSAKQIKANTDIITYFSDGTVVSVKK